MLQVKIFEGPEADELEQEINTWLKDNSSIELVKVLQSESAVADDDGDFCGNTTISVFYRQ
ncbi:MAG: sporulation protein Cse60 [Candidatus Sericytochromatia bacterium]|nr:sporulation protein Cse60 [Candidatus Sericytochromatia bacterium]